jgi:predicted nucleotidyltransferase
MEQQNFKKDELVFYHVAGRSFGGKCLPGSEALVIQEKYLAKTSDALMQKVLKKKWLFKLLPFVKEVAVCNTVAFGTADVDSDIDLFIIIDSKYFFTGRFLISFLVELFGLRRKGSKVKGRFCLSFFVAEDCLDFSEILIENDVYFYYWFKNLVFLKGDVDIQSRLIDANYFEVEGFRNEMGYSKSVFAWLIELITPNFIEVFLKNIQLKRANNKNEALGNPKGVVIKDGMLKFHVKDIRPEFRDAYLSLLLR